MSRIPQEPLTDPQDTAFCSNNKVRLPPPLDFCVLEQLPVQERNKIANDYVNNLVDHGLMFCDPELKQLPDVSPQHVKTLRVPLQGATGKGRSSKISIDVETVLVEGVRCDLKGVRHIAHHVPVNANQLFDAVCKNLYTNAVDPYLQRAELIHDLATDHSWCHVSYTMDTFAPVLSTRDFVSIDVACEDHLLYCSRSCRHPVRPPLPTPAFRSKETGAFRVPFQFSLRVFPDADDPKHSCTMIQFQFSDLGGILSPAQQTSAVIRFGARNIPTLVQLALEEACRFDALPDPLLHVGKDLSVTDNSSSEESEIEEASAHLVGLAI